jgi:hypothetical protein
MSDAYTTRRERVAIQVCTRWSGDGYDDDDMLAVRNAADVAFAAGINDLDWEAATFGRLMSEA